MAAADALIDSIVNIDVLCFLGFAGLIALHFATPSILEKAESPEEIQQDATPYTTPEELSERDRRYFRRLLLYKACAYGSAASVYVWVCISLLSKTPGATFFLVLLIFVTVMAVLMSLASLLPLARWGMR